MKTAQDSGDLLLAPDVRFPTQLNLLKEVPTVNEVIYEDSASLHDQKNAMSSKYRHNKIYTLENLRQGVNRIGNKFTSFPK